MTLLQVPAVDERVSSLTIPSLLSSTWCFTHN